MRVQFYWLLLLLLLLQRLFPYTTLTDWFV
jgi:hypothetical protein